MFKHERLRRKQNFRFEESNRPGYREIRVRKGRIKSPFCGAWQGMKIFWEEKGNYADTEKLEWKLWKIPKFCADQRKEFSNVKLIAASLWGLLSFVSYRVTSASLPSPKKKKTRKARTTARVKWSAFCLNPPLQSHRPGAERALVVVVPSISSIPLVSSQINWAGWRRNKH